MRINPNHPHGRVLIPATALGDRERWLKARQGGVTATDQRVLAGHGYSGESVYDRWLAKVTPILDNRDASLRMQIGSEMEAAIAKVFTARTGIHTARAGMIQSTRWPFIVASPDRNCECGGHVELKTTDRWQLDRDHSGWVLPEKWDVQGAHQVLASGRDHVHFAALIGRDDFTWWTRYYTDAELDMCLARAEVFWEYVQSGEAPPIQWGSVTPTEIAQRFPKTEGARIVEGEELARLIDLIRARQELKAAGKDSVEVLTQVENNIKVIVGEASELWAPDGMKPLVKYPVVLRRNIAYDKMIADYSIDVNLYTTMTGSRSFTSVAKV